MKRRDFLQQAGLVGMGSSTILAADGNTTVRAAEQQIDEESKEEPITSVLITSTHSRVGQAVVSELDGQFRLRLTAPVDAFANHPFIPSDLGHDESTNELVRGMDAIVHVAEPPLNSDQSARIDYQTRCTYNLLLAAATEGVRKVIYLSSLEVMMGYDDDFEVTEVWRPLISSNPGMLSNYLGEFTCREFAHELKMPIIVLRLGKVVRADEVKDKPFDPMWVDERDVAHAVSKALDLWPTDDSQNRSQWTIFHIQSGSPRDAFISQKAESQLGYTPQYKW